MLGIPSELFISFDSLIFVVFPFCKLFSYFNICIFYRKDSTSTASISNIHGSIRVFSSTLLACVHPQRLRRSVETGRWQRSLFSCRLLQEASVSDTYFLHKKLRVRQGTQLSADDQTIRDRGNP